MSDPKDGDDDRRDEHGERLPVDQDKREGSGTLEDILARGRERAEAAWQRAEADRIALEEHRAVCRAEECQRCERAKCYRCGSSKQGLAGLCEMCREAERFERVKARAFATLPKRFRWATECGLAVLATRVRLPAERISAALSWAAGLEAKPPSLALVGITGAGKTSLAIALFATWFDRHREEGARFVPALELGLARARFPLGHDDPPAVVAAIDAPLLILDDLGAEAPAHSDTLRQVLHARHNEERPTWITTGLSHAAITQRYDGGLARRIFEESKHVTVGA